MSENTHIAGNMCTRMTAENPDAIWNTPDPLANFPNDNCLPDIGSCQVSSILSTLENSPPKNVRTDKSCSEQQDMIKSFPIKLINTDLLLSDDLRKHKRKKNGMPEKSTLNNLYQEIYYFGCTFCPFICTKDSKITDHINAAHKDRESNVRPKLNCPGCSNVFYHKLSLRSHLLYDHEVDRSDILKIVNAVVYLSMVKRKSEKITPSDFLWVETHVSSDEETNKTNTVPSEMPKPASPTTDSNEYTPKIDTLAQFTSEVNDEPKTVDAPDLTNIPDLNEIHIEDFKRRRKCCISTCAVRMRDVDNMAYHIKCHFNKVFRCLECEATFVIWKTLQTHLWRSHNINMEMFSCDKCDYKTYSLAKLNNVHKLIHGDERPFLCDLCGKGFKNPKQLRNHKIIHKVKTTDPVQVCQICNRTFTGKRQLKVHMAGVHQKIKPYSCNYCGYKGASNGALKLHIRQHTGEKPFSCDACEYTTSDHNSLRRHKSRHSGIKKYKCLHCEYACIQSSTFKTHLKTKHPGLENELMFSCRHCQFRSISKDKYMSHIACHKEKKTKNGRKPMEFFDGEVNSEMMDDMTDSKKIDVTDNLIDFMLPSEMKPKEALEMRLDELPVALISKVDAVSAENCIILPIQNNGILNLAHPISEPETISTAIISNGLQYLYSPTNVILEVADEKKNIT